MLLGNKVERLQHIHLSQQSLLWAPPFLVLSGLICVIVGSVPLSTRHRSLVICRPCAISCPTWGSGLSLPFPVTSLQHISLIPRHSAPQGFQRDRWGSAACYPWELVLWRLLVPFSLLTSPSFTSAIIAYRHEPSKSKHCFSKVLWL